MRTKNIAVRAALAAAVTMGYLGTFATAATAAASWHGIEGTVYQKRTGKDWYHSDYERPKNGAGPVHAEFSNLPKSGLVFKVRTKSNRTIGKTQIWTSQETDLTRTLSKNVKSGTPMYTSFKQYNPCDRCSPYSFSGSLFY